MSEEKIQITINETGAAVAARNVQQLGTSAERSAVQVTTLENSVQRASSAMHTALAAIGIGIGIHELIDYADAWDRTSNRLQLVTENTKELGAAQQKLFEIAQATRTSFDQTAALYVRMKEGAEGLGISEEGIYKALTTVNQALALNDQSGESSGRAMRVLGAAFQEGTFKGGEFGMLLKQMPTLAQAMALGTGQSIRSLDDAIKNGTFSLRDFVQAMDRVSGQVGASFNNMHVPVTQAMTFVKNAFERYLGMLNESKGLTDSLSRALLFLGNNIELVGGSVATFVAAILTFTTVMRVAVPLAVAFGIATGGLPVALAVLAASLAGAYVSTKMFGEGTEKAAEHVDTLGHKTALGGENLQKWNRYLEESKTKTEGWSAATDKAAQSTQAFNGEMSSTTPTITTYTTKMTGATTSTNSFSTSLNTAAEIIKFFSSDLENTNVDLDALFSKLQRMQSDMAGFASATDKATGSLKQMASAEKDVIAQSNFFNGGDFGGFAGSSGNTQGKGGINPNAGADGRIYASRNEALATYSKGDPYMGTGGRYIPPGGVDPKTLTHFAAGGSFTVGGAGGTDSKMVSFMATPGEKVTVAPPGGQGNPINVHMTVIANDAESFRRSKAQLEAGIYSGMRRVQSRIGA